MKLSIITTCKNRLDHLRETLPLMNAMENAEVIVVDYGCTQGTSRWVKANFPRVKLIDISDDPVFHVSRARNIGAQYAKGEFLCFVDADTFLVGDLQKWIIKNDLKNAFVVMQELWASTAGFLICSPKDFFSVDGYDEALRGWAPEDVDLYERLEATGLIRKFFPESLISSITHGDELRQFSSAAGTFKNRQHAHSLGSLYRIVKKDLTNLTDKSPALEFRRDVITQIIELDRLAEQQNSNHFILEINLKPRELRPTASKCNTSLIYKFERNFSL